MCGIFGMIRCVNAQHPDRASAAFVELGRLAVQRGRDAAGFALSSATHTGQAHWPSGLRVSSRDTEIDGVRIIKDVCSFDDLWDDDKHLPLLHGARVALGHTRWATQGKRDALVNASPLIAGNLVGTHNGDIEVESLSTNSGYALYGTTDTERLYRDLDNGRRDRRKIVKTLTEVEGRAALAWIDRERPDRVYLARAALSPLSVAWDADGNMYWASNPDWFRQIDAKFNNALGFHDITMVREGILLTVDVSGDEPVIDNMREFKPQCRPSDARLSDVVVWRGFNSEDIAADKAQAHHGVAKARPSKWVTTTSATAGKGRKGGKGGKGAQTPSGASFWPPLTPPSLPRYTDNLGDLSGMRYEQTSLDARLAAEEPEQDDLYPWEHAAMEVSDEVDAALLTWAEEGENPAVVEALRQPLTFKQEVALAKRYGLSGVAALGEFRKAIFAWIDATSDSVEDAATAGQ